MRIQLPEPQDIFVAILLLTLTTWQAQTVLAFFALILIVFHHWIIGGIFGAIAIAAFSIRQRFRL